MKTATTNPTTQNEREEFFRDIYRPPYHGERLTWKEIKRTFHSQEAKDKLQLRTDARRLNAALLAAGVSVDLQEYPRRWHVFQQNADVLADADRALDAVAAFVGSSVNTATGAP